MSIEKLKAAHNAASNGIWTVECPNHFTAHVVSPTRIIASSGCNTQMLTKEDADFIALAHNMMPALLELYDLLKEMVATYETGDSKYLEEAFDSARFALDQINLEN